MRKANRAKKAEKFVCKAAPDFTVPGEFDYYAQAALKASKVPAISFDIETTDDYAPSYSVRSTKTDYREVKKTAKQRHETYADFLGTLDAPIKL